MTSSVDRWAASGGLVSVILVVGIAMGLSMHSEASRDRLIPDVPEEVAKEVVARHLEQPLREEPAKFAPNHREPVRREVNASGAIGESMFMADYDLVHVDDPRVWWESDNDDHENDTEDDHLMHRAMEEPFRRLVNLVEQADGRLKVQDTYRAQGIHHARSLHKEGRAIDLTAEGISLSKLAKLTWAAGFDWVLFEAPRGSGSHIHASVRADRQEQIAALPDEEDE